MILFRDKKFSFDYELNTVHKGHSEFIAPHPLLERQRKIYSSTWDSIILRSSLWRLNPSLNPLNPDWKKGKKVDFWQEPQRRSYTIIIAQPQTLRLRAWKQLTYFLFFCQFSLPPSLCFEQIFSFRPVSKTPRRFQQFRSDPRPRRFQQLRSDPRIILLRTRTLIRHREGSSRSTGPCPRNEDQTRCPMNPGTGMASRRPVTFGHEIFWWGRGNQDSGNSSTVKWRKMSKKYILNNTKSQPILSGNRHVNKKNLKMAIFK